MILADCHVHTHFSSDSETKPEAQIEAAIQKGLTILCTTDHEDPDYAVGSWDFDLDVESYYQTMSSLQHIYADKLDLRIGMELGLQPHLLKEAGEYAATKPWDFIIGSTHVVNRVDPYYPAYWEGRNERDAILHYFEQTLLNITTFDCFDVYGHLDYIIRYAPAKNAHYRYEDYKDILDEILRTLIQKGKGIECNTGGYKHGLMHPNPEETLLNRYFELGGEILTTGSDAHKPEHIAFEFQRLPELLKACGARYYTVFKDRKPVMLPL